MKKFVLITILIAFIICKISYSQTNVSGDITTNTTWTIDKSPYNVGILVTVDAGVTLTIASGVKVNLNYRSSILVNGTLIASGVTFYGDQTHSDYFGGGISFGASSVNSSLDNDIFNKTGAGNYGGGCIIMSSSSVTVNNCKFIKCAGTAIAVENNASPLIKNSILDTASINVASGSPTIENITINGQQDYGMTFSGPDAQPIVNGCTIESNGSYGNVYAHPGSLNNLGQNNFTEIVLISDAHVTKNAIFPSGYNYHLLGDFTVDKGATLTIENNTKVDMNYPMVSYRYGSIMIDGSLIATGTQFYTSDADTTIFGGSIMFDTSCVNTTLNNVVFHKIGVKYLGALSIKSSKVTIKNCQMSKTYLTAIGIDNCSPDIENVTIDWSKQCGINISEGSPILKQISITNNSPYYYAINLQGNGAQPILSESSIYGSSKGGRVMAYPMSMTKFGPNNFKDIDITGAEITQNSSFPKGYTYHLLGELLIDAGATFTILAGTKIDMTSDIQVHGSLMAKGNGSDNVTFFCANPDTNQYGMGINFNSDASASVLNYCNFTRIGTGNNYYAVSINNTAVTLNYCRFSKCLYTGIGVLGSSSSPKISNCYIEKCKLYGIEIKGSPIIDGCTISNTRYYPIYISMKYLNPVITNCTIKGTNDAGKVWAYPSSVAGIGKNNFKNILLSGEELIVDATLPGNLIYELEGDITVDKGVTLTILSPSEFDNTNKISDITVLGSLNASGTAQNLIQFYCHKPNVNSYGGSIYFQAGSTNSIMNNVTMYRMGYGTSDTTLNYQGALIRSSGVQINNCLFRNCKQSAIIVDYKASPVIKNTIIDSCSDIALSIKNSAPKLINCSIINNQSYGVLIDHANDASSTPAFTNCNLVNNKYYGMFSVGPKITDATECWWGDATGPKNTSNNPNGKGDNVSDYIKFNPWLGKTATGPTASIKVSYVINNMEFVVDTVYVQLSEDIGNLNFKTNPSSDNRCLKMKYSGKNFQDSKTFVIADTVYNDNKPYYFCSKPFKIIDGNHFTVLTKLNIMNTDNNTNDNTIERQAEVWLADFHYGQDNFSFYNYDFDLHELGQFCTNSYCNPFFILPTIANELYFKAYEGHCFGFSVLSILYQKHRDWIPNNPNLLSTYAQPESFELKERIRLAFYTQLKFIFYYLVVSPFFSSNDFAMSELTYIKKELGSNVLVTANYDFHSTTLHTLIKAGEYYNLYEYNNNNGDNHWTSYAPNNRGLFHILNQEQQVEFSSADHSYYFSYPNFIFDKSNKDVDLGFNKILDSLLQVKIDTLLKYRQNMIVYRQYSAQDTTATALLSFSKGLMNVEDYGLYKIFYLDNSIQPDITASSNQGRTGNFALMGINTSGNSADKVSQFLYENVPVLSNSSKVSFTKVFNDSLQKCTADENGDGTALFNIKPAYKGNKASYLNIPPFMIQEAGIIALNVKYDSVSFRLKDYINDEDFGSLNFGLNFNDTLFDCHIADTVLIIKLKKVFTDYSLIELKVSDGTNNVVFPIYVHVTPNASVAEIRNSHLYIYPDPSNGRFYINTQGLQGIANIEVYNNPGKLVFSRQYKMTTSNNHLIVDISNNAKGVYFIKISIKDKVYVAKAILN